jgi:hypothetical protein
LPTTVDDYMTSLEGKLGNVARALREVVLKAGPELTESFKWGQALYSYNGPICYIRAGNLYVTFGFWNGDKMKRINDRVEAYGDGVSMVHLKLRTLKDIDERAIKAMINRSIKVNRVRGDPRLRQRQGHTSADVNIEKDRGPDKSETEGELTAD